MTETKSEAPTHQPADEAKAIYAGMRMLAVDDDATYVETYRKYFAKRGFSVDVATDLSSVHRRQGRGQV